MRAGVAYSPGSWLGLVSGGTAVLLEPGAPERMVEQLWQAVESGAALEELLGTVVSGFGANLSAMPQFGIVSCTDGIHAVVRGDVDVSSGPGGAELNGRGVSSWAEGRLPAGAVTITAGACGSASAGESAPWLPLRAGAVHLGMLRMGAQQPDEPGRGPDRAGAAETVRPAGDQTEAGFAESLAMTSIYVPEEEPDGGASAARPEADAEGTADAEPAGPDSEAADDDVDQTIVHVAAQQANLPAAPQQEATKKTTEGTAVVPKMPPGQPVDLIDAVPWLTPSAPARAAAAATAATAATAAEGDHDGQTLMRSDLPDVPAAPVAAPSTVSPSTAPMVLARLCRQGHANPPTSSACTSCGSPLADDAQEVQRPVLGRMRLSTGDVVELDRPVIVGRQPSANRVQGSVMPRLVPVHSASGDISRSHVEVRLEGWHVILADLKSTNGTVLIRGRQAPRRLGHGEAVMLLDGDIADLGDGISLRFEDLP